MTRFHALCDDAVEVQATCVQDAAPGREAVALASHARQLAPLFRLRFVWTNREDHQDLQQRTGPQFSLGVWG